MPLKYAAQPVHLRVRREGTYLEVRFDHQSLTKRMNILMVGVKCSWRPKEARVCDDEKPKAAFHMRIYIGR